VENSIKQHTLFYYLQLSDNENHDYTLCPQKNGPPKHV